MPNFHFQRPSGKREGNPTEKKAQEADRCSPNSARGREEPSLSPAGRSPGPLSGNRSPPGLPSDCPRHRERVHPTSVRRALSDRY